MKFVANKWTSRDITAEEARMLVGTVGGVFIVYEKYLVITFAGLEGRTAGMVIVV